MERPVSSQGPIDVTMTGRLPANSLLSLGIHSSLSQGKLRHCWGSDHCLLTACQPARSKAMEAPPSAGVRLPLLGLLEMSQLPLGTLSINA